MPNERSSKPETPEPYNILFVCTGNTCRSPMARAIAERAVDQRGWDHVAVDSAGVAAGVGDPASRLAVEVASANGLELAGHHTQPLRADILEWADLILVMSPSHRHIVEELGYGSKAGLVTGFLDGDERDEPVEDPVGGGIAAYERAFRQLERAVEGVLSTLEPILSP